MKTKPTDIPKFGNEAEEADWWASRQGREFVKRKSAEPLKKGAAPKGSRLVAPTESDADRSDSVAIARTGHNEGAGDCFAQRRGIPDPTQDVGARRLGPRGAQTVKAGLPRKCVWPL